MADNFSRQYSHLCPDRVPLFLYPLNECEVPVRLGCGGQGSGSTAEGGGGWARASPSRGPELIAWEQHQLKCQWARARCESPLGRWRPGDPYVSPQGAGSSPRVRPSRGKSKEVRQNEQSGPPDPSPGLFLSSPVAQGMSLSLSGTEFPHR